MRLQEPKTTPFIENMRNTTIPCDAPTLLDLDACETEQCAATRKLATGQVPRSNDAEALGSLNKEYWDVCAVEQPTVRITAWYAATGILSFSVCFLLAAFDLV